jgi:hypothetical protein
MIIQEIYTFLHKLNEQLELVHINDNTIYMHVIKN